MKRSHKFLTIAFLATATLMTASSVSYAQNEAPKPNYMLEILPTKKVIHVKETGLPGNTKLREFLGILPELLQRGDDGLFTNYDIQFDGKSTGSARDVILETTWIGDVEKIEITSSPTVTQQKSGQGGVINIVPVKLKEGFGGNVTLDASTEWDAMPSLNLNYKNKKLEIRGNLSLEYYDIVKGKEYKTTYDTYKVEALDSLWLKNYLQTAKVNMVYTFSEKSKLKAWFWESGEVYDEKRKAYRSEVPLNPLTNKFGEYAENTSFSRNQNINARTEYEQVFNGGGKVNIDVGYQHDNNAKWKERSRKDIDKQVSPFTVDGEVKLTLPISTMTRGKGVIEFGANTYYTKDRSDVTDNSSHNLAVFGTFKYTGSRISVNSGLKYTFNEMSHSYGTPGGVFEKKAHDMTGNVNIVWQMAPHNALRLLASRNYIRPGMDLLYPFMVWQPENERWFCGNPKLESAYLNTAELSYIFDWNKGTQSLMTHVGFRYDYAEGLFEPRQFYDVNIGSVYTTYVNAGNENIYNINATVHYKIGIVTLIFAGNLFESVTWDGPDKIEHGYFNLNLASLFRLKNRWSVSLYTLYNSKEVKGNTVMSDYLYARARVNKSLGEGWTVHLGLSDIFHHKCESTSVDEKGYVTVGRDNIYDNYIDLGVSYRFGTSR